MAGIVIFSMNHYISNSSASIPSVFSLCKFHLSPQGVEGPHEQCGTYSLATIRSGHVGEGRTVAAVNAVRVGLVSLSKGNGRVDVVLGLVGAGGVGAIGILLLDGRVPEPHGAGRLLVGGQDLARDGVGHGLLPQVGRLVGQGVVDDDAVVVVDVGGPLVADELELVARLVLAVDLGRDAPRRVGVRA